MQREDRGRHGVEDRGVCGSPRCVVNPTRQNEVNLEGGPLAGPDRCESQGSSISLIGADRDLISREEAHQVREEAQPWASRFAAKLSQATPPFREDRIDVLILTRMLRVLIFLGWLFQSPRHSYCGSASR
jgi:hypothetical protein